MRLYHYMVAKYAISALQDHRLKVAELEDLNDPFELRSMQFRNAEYEVDVRGFRQGTAKTCGFLCLSATWNNILMWSHYADRHRGMCLAFDVKNSDQTFTKVKYSKTIQATPTFNGLTPEKMLSLLSTKSDDWKYECEWRAFPTLVDPEWNESLKRHLQFVPFGDLLKVSEVLIGVRCREEDEAAARHLCPPEVGFRRVPMREDHFGLA
jgi:hypothetical protein